MALALGALDAEKPTKSNACFLPPKLHRTTVARHKKGETQPLSAYHPQASLLSQQQEEELIRQIDELTQRGFPPNHHQLRV